MGAAEKASRVEVEDVIFPEQASTRPLSAREHGQPWTGGKLNEREVVVASPLQVLAVQQGENLP